MSEPPRRKYEAPEIRAYRPATADPEMRAAFDRIKPLLPEGFTPQVVVRCPFHEAPGLLYVVGEAADGEPLLFHQKPECSRFIELEVCDFLEAARHALPPQA